MGSPPKPFYTNLTKRSDQGEGGLALSIECRPRSPVR